MTVIAVAGMLGSVIAPGIDSVNNADELQDTINKTLALSQKIKAQFDTLISATTQLDQELKQEVLDNINTMTKLNAQVVLAQQRAGDNYRTIQMIGVIFLVFIGLILILKKFGMLDALEEAIKTLFRWRKKK